MRWTTTVCWGFVLLWQASCGRIALAAAPIKLNGPLVAGGDAINLRVSPDGSRVAYRADQDTNEVFELFSVPSTGGTPIKLNVPLPVDGDVADTLLQFSPNSASVLYVADQDANGVNEIYIVPSTGGAPLQLNGPLVAGGNVDFLAPNRFSPDGSRVLYLADQITDDVLELFIVPSGGGAPLKLNGALVAGGDVDFASFQFSPDGSRVLYRADQVTDEVDELFIVPSVGGAPIKLNVTPAAGGDVSFRYFQFSPDGSRVVYRADQDTNDVQELFSVPSTGGTPVKLNGTLVANGDVIGTLQVQISADGSRVLYLADQLTNDVNELFSVPIGGGTPVKLNGALVAGGDVSTPTGDFTFLFSPNSNRVVYHADQITDEVFELFSVPSAGGTPVKLNGPLVAGGDVSKNNIQFSPDSSRVIYIADQITDGVTELFSVSSTGVSRVKLSGPIVAGGGIGPDPHFNPDGSRVVYLAEQDTDDVLEIFLVPSSGGMPVKINGPMAIGGNVAATPLEFFGGSRFSPDGSLLFYVADQDTDNVFEAFVRIVRLRADVGGSWDDGAIWDHGVTPDEVIQVFIEKAVNVVASGTSVVRTVNELEIGGGPGTSTLTLEDGAGITALNGFSIVADGVVRGDGTLAAELRGSNKGIVSSNAGQRLRFTSTEFASEGRIAAIGNAENLAEIEFDGTVSTDATALTVGEHSILRFGGGFKNKGELSLSDGENHIFGDIANAGTVAVSGGAAAVFYDDVDQDGTLQVDNRAVAVFLGDFTGSGGSTGGGDIFFEGDLRPGDSPGSVEFGNNVALGAGATLEIELAGATPGTQYDQVHVTGSLSLDGTLAVSLIDGFAPAAGDSFDVLDWSSLAGTFHTLALPALDGNLTWNTSRLYTSGVLSVAIPEPASGVLVICGLAVAVWMAALGRPRRRSAKSVLRRTTSMKWATAACLGIVVLCASNFARVALAAAPIKLNGPLVAGGNASARGFSADGSRVVYTADQDIDGISEVFSVPSTGGPVVKLNGPLVAGGEVDVGSVEISSDGARVLYEADQDTLFVNEVFSVPIGGGTPEKLNGTLVAGGDVEDSQFSPDGSRVLYRADEDTNLVTEIFIVPSTGGMPVKLNGPLVAGGDAGGQFSPNGSRVIYRADQVTDEVDELFSVPSTGGMPVKLNGPLVAGGDVTRIQTLPDSSRVVYRADETTDEVFEIFSVPTSGGAAVKLNGALVTNGDVVSFNFSSNSSRVVYRADQSADDVFELFSVPANGGAAVKLNGPLVAGGDVETNDFLISPDGNRVLYRADQITDEVFELFSVPIGGGTAVKLNGAFVPGGNIFCCSFDISPDSSRVIYVADQFTDGVHEIFSVPITGGTPVKLNGPLVAGGSVSQTTSGFNPDGSRVFYYADQDTDGVAEIYMVPSGGGTFVKISGPMVVGGTALSGTHFSPDGSLLLYNARQDDASKTEVYARIVRLHAMSGAGSWDDGAIWDHGVAPDEVMQVFIDDSTNVIVAGDSVERTVNELQVGGGPGTSVLTLADGAGITALNGLSILAGGVVRGEGKLEAELLGTSKGEVRAGPGDHLQLSSTEFISEGRVEAIGTKTNPAEIEFSGAVTNVDSTGLIAGNNAILRFAGGLTNKGSLALNLGESHVFGDVDNSGSIVVSGGANATFNDDVDQDGTLRVSQVGSTTSSATFLGAFTGPGGSTGGGDLVFKGELGPGDSPARVKFDNNVTLSDAATVRMELRGTTPGSQFDQIEVTGSLSLDGTLAVSLIGGFSPALGNSFDLFDWGSLSGTFAALDLPALGTGLMWNASQLYTAGVLSVALAGDYNLNGIVDAADYVVWRKMLGQMGGGLVADGNGNDEIDSGDYDVWQANFGQSAPGTGSLNATVPEPTSGSLLILGAAMGTWMLRRVASQVPSTH